MIPEGQVTEQAVPPHSDLFFQQLLSNLPAATYTCDAEGLITYYNEQAVEIWGREARLKDPLDRYCGSTRLFTTDGAPLAHEQCFMALALRNEVSYRGVEAVIERPDGRRVTILAHINPIHDDEGRLLGAVNVLLDISERKLAEQAPARLAAIVESSDDAIVSKDLSGIIRSWNRAAQEIFGFTPEEAIGRPITMIIPKERLEEEADILARLRRGERIDHFETVRQRKDGTPIHVSLTVSPIKDSNGNVVGASKIARDITGHKRAQEALVEQARTLSTINRAASSLSAELDLHRLIQAVTRAGRELCRSQFGAFFYDQPNDESRNYVLVCSDGQLPEGFDESYALRNYPEVFGTVAGTEPAERDGLVGSYLAVPIVPRSGKAIGVLFLGDERRGVLTEQLQQVMTAIASHAATAIDNALLYEEARHLNETLEEKVAQRTADLNELNHELETFNYSVAHDLRGSLRGIDGFSNLILEEAGNEMSQSVVGYFERIRAAAQRMGQLLDNLLELSALMRVQVRRKKVDLGGLARIILDELRQLEPERNVEVVISDCPPASGDPGLMRMAMENLIGNAWKFSRDRSPGRIEVGCESTDEERIYFVRDNGVGFDMRYEEKLFEPFQRLHAPETFEGTGIGLANVKRIIDKHGGRIWATSEPGKGATFYFTLR